MEVLLNNLLLSLTRALFEAACMFIKSCKMMNTFSEFSGLCYQDQLKKLAAGKEIMVKEDIWEPHFMAPAHSFDDVTIQCLSELGFQTITDGYGFYPYEYKGMLLVPQLFSRPIPLPTGIQTIALHLNHGSRKEIDYLLNFLKLNKDRVVPYSSVVKCNPSNDWMAKFFRFLVSLQKNTQHNPPSKFSFVPVQDFTETWTDEKLYKKYAITDEEIEFIDSMIRPMELDNE